MKKILVIEDEVDMAFLLKEMLEKHNYEVITAYDGQEGLDKMREGPNLVILDLIMPNMSGIEVLKRMRFNEATKKIPVIILTARRESNVIFEAMHHEAFDYIIKPFEIKELLDAVSKALL